MATADPIFASASRLGLYPCCQRSARAEQSLSLTVESSTYQYPDAKGLCTIRSGSLKGFFINHHSLAFAAAPLFTDGTNAKYGTLGCMSNSAFGTQ